MIELFSRGLLFNGILVIVEVVQKRGSGSGLWVMKSWRRHGFGQGLSVSWLEPMRRHGAGTWPTNMRHAPGMERCIGRRWESRSRHTGISGLSCCSHWRCDCDSVWV